jgi:hypothetical protein
LCGSDCQEGVGRAEGGREELLYEYLKYLKSRQEFVANIIY